MSVQIVPPNKLICNDAVSLAPSPLTVALLNIALQDPPTETGLFVHLLSIAWNTGTAYQTQFGLSYDYDQNRIRLTVVHRDGTASYYSTSQTYTPSSVKAIALIVISNTAAFLCVNGTDVYYLTSDDFGLAQTNYTILVLGQLGNLVSDIGFTCGEVAIWNTNLFPGFLAGAMSYGPALIKPENLVHLWKFGVNATANYEDSLNANKAWKPVYTGYLPTVTAETVYYIEWQYWPGSPWENSAPFTYSATRRTETRRSLMPKRRRKMLYVKPGETASEKLRVYFQLYRTDGVTAATTEGGGQPEISVNGAAWTANGISTLTHIGNGRYYAAIQASTVASLTPGSRIETRYKSANTCECQGDSVLISYFVPSYLDLANTIFNKLDAICTKLDDMIENAGTYYRYKDAAAKDWTQSERAQIRKALGVTGTQSDLDANGVIVNIASALYWAELESQIVSATEVRWIARWYKTESPVTASNVYITVKDTSGNQVFGNMAASSGDGGYTYVLSTSNTITAGAPYVMTVQATVDGVVRSFSQIVRPQ